MRRSSTSERQKQALGSRFALTRCCPVDASGSGSVGLGRGGAETEEREKADQCPQFQPNRPDVELIEAPAGGGFVRTEGGFGEISASRGPCGRDAGRDLEFGGSGEGQGQKNEQNSSPWRRPEVLAAHQRPEQVKNARQQTVEVQAMQRWADDVSSEARRQDGKRNGRQSGTEINDAAQPKGEK